MEKLPVTHKDKYLIIIFPECLELLAHNSRMVIKGISVHELFNEELAELSALLVSFCKSVYVGVVGSHGSGRENVRKLDFQLDSNKALCLKHHKSS